MVDVILPVLDEAAALPAVLGRMPAGHRPIVVDNGSSDGSAQVARGLGLELVLDFAINCSPDHPWVAEHPDWFYHRPDGTIKFAENPPNRCGSHWVARDRHSNDALALLTFKVTQLEPRGSRHNPC